MTPNQQEEMEKEFEKSDRELADSFSEKIIFSRGFKAAYTLQQEKIEKLEKVILDQEKERQSAEAFWKRRLEIHQREIDSLKRDLDIASRNLIKYAEKDKVFLHNLHCAKEIRQTQKEVNEMLEKLK